MIFYNPQVSDPLIARNHEIAAQMQRVSNMSVSLTHRGWQNPQQRHAGRRSDWAQCVAVATALLFGGGVLAWSTSHPPPSPGLLLAAGTTKSALGSICLQTTITGTALFGKKALIFRMGWLEVLSRFKWLPCTRITCC